MPLDEKFMAPDKVARVSHRKLEAQKKRKLEKIRKKLNLPEHITDDDIEGAQSKIADAMIQHVEDVEQDFENVEGNIQEKLANAAASGQDGDIKAAMGLAKNYHQKSTHHAHKQLTSKNQAAGEKLFAHKRKKAA